MLWHVQTGIKTRTEGKNTPCEILWFLFYPGAGEVITMFSANQRSGEAQPPPQTCALKYTSAIYVWVWYPPAWKCCLAARSGTYGVILKCAPPFEHTSGYFSMTLGCLLMLLDFAVEYVKNGLVLDTTARAGAALSASTDPYSTPISHWCSSAKLNCIAPLDFHWLKLIIQAWKEYKRVKIKRKSRVDISLGQDLFIIQWISFILCIDLLLVRTNLQFISKLPDLKQLKYCNIKS